jgi:coproporphyrinogen III oxidase-like Fe-S oxidoreductase|tara:strand:- start:487 stop:663 length:177 start_codon:yes stop_codon:yes gene_type:complete
MKNFHDVRINMDIILGVPSKSQEEAYNEIQKLNTKELLALALEQLPFVELDHKSKTLN